MPRVLSNPDLSDSIFANRLTPRLEAPQEGCVP
jgi:hypothetical protein